MRTLVWIGTLLVCFVSGGATCARRQTPIPFPPPPVVFGETPTIDELASVVNRTDSIRQLSCNSASVEVLSMPKLPRLGATLNIQRDRNFRLRASLPIVLGAGIDMGSNDQVFWFEVPDRMSGMSKTLYYAQHEQYRQQLHGSVLPVDPTWVIDALGLVHVDPATVVAGPVRRDDGKLEIRNTLSMPDGIYQRVCFIEASAGYVTDQFLYAPDGRLIAKSQATNHRYDDQHQCALPHLVQLDLTPASGPPLAMKIEIGSYAVNQLLSGDPNLFTMPQTASQAVDLTTLSGPPIAGSATRVEPPIGYSARRSSPIPLRGMR